MRIKVMARWVFIWFLSVAGVTAEENWQTVRVGRLDYVTLESFAKFYGFQKPVEIRAGRPFDLSSPSGVLSLTVDSREMKWKGVRYWLNHSIRQQDEVTLVSRLDLAKTFEPLLRPNVEIPKRPVQGVVVDPGHGGGDEGTRAARGLSEKTANLDVAKRLVRLLDDAGVPWVLARSKDRYVDHGDRSARASEHPGYLFVSIHFNEDYDRNTTGWETYCVSPQYGPSTSSGGSFVGDEDQVWPGNDFDHHNFLLAQAIHRSAVLSKTNAPSDRGLKKARFKVLRLAHAPGVLVEGGFLSNPQEATMLRTEAYRQQVADWIFKGIMAYRKSQEILSGPSRLSVERPEKVSPSTPELRPVMNLESVPAFRSKETGSNSPVTTTNGTPTTNKANPTDPGEGEVRRAVPVQPIKKVE
jgi:N-acetylmuramoyl-L-alanine amidase